MIWWNGDEWGTTFAGGAHKECRGYEKVRPPSAKFTDNECAIWANFLVDANFSRLILALGFESNTTYVIQTSSTDTAAAPGAAAVAVAVAEAVDRLAAGPDSRRAHNL